MPNSQQPAHPASAPAVIRFGRCELRLDAHELLLGGRPQPVRRRVLDLIACLVQQRPRTVSHRELLVAMGQPATGSSTLLTRAVMEARRAIGDDADEPQFIVNVHGVGYRFSGELREQPAAGDEADLDPGAAVAALRRLLTRARQALYDGQLDQAGLFADQALAQADAVSSNAEKVRALAVCSTVAMRRDSAPAAARLAARALQIAKGEGYPPLIAQARVAVGAVHLIAGDLDLATRHFQESREALSAPGHEGDLLRCQTFLCRALRDAGDVEAALQLCRRNIELAQRQGVTQFQMVDRINEVLYAVLLGDHQVAQGDIDAAQRSFAQALASSESVWRDLLAMKGPAALRHLCLSNHAMVLERLDRLDEAWEALHQSDREPRQTTADGSPLDTDLEQTLRMQRARLLGRCGRHEEALQIIESAIARAEAAAHKSWLPELYGCASAIAEGAGQGSKALHWARRQFEAQLGLQRLRSASLRAVLAAEMQATAKAEGEQTELTQARAQIHELLQVVVELRRQLRDQENRAAPAPQPPPGSAR